MRRIVRSIPIDRQVSLMSTELEIHAVRRPELAGTFLAVNRAFRERLAGGLVDALGTRSDVCPRWVRWTSSTR